MRKAAPKPPPNAKLVLINSETMSGVRAACKRAGVTLRQGNFGRADDMAWVWVEVEVPPINAEMFAALKVARKAMEWALNWQTGNDAAEFQRDIDIVNAAIKKAEGS